MRGLRKYLTPFAPDQSGAVSVLYELGGMIVVCDAGGCTGNICGFDEPRWHTCRSAVFSAGLRDMDAILGRDDKLLAGLRDAAEKIHPLFAAIVGTPVPAVIGTDYLALRRMAEGQTGLPLLTVDTTGTRLYDVGAEKAYLALFDRFAADALPTVPGRVGVLGVNPLDMSDAAAGDKIRSLLPGAVCYGMGAGLDAVRSASSCQRNIVAAPSGLRAARLLERRFGTPWEAFDPLAESRLPALDWGGRRVLVVAQQVTGLTLRGLLLSRGAAEVTCATWFMRPPELSSPGDISLTEEDDFAALVREGRFDILLADEVLWRIAPDFPGIRADLRQFPVSGRLWED